MKIKLALAMMFLGSMGHAYEIQDNPDRRISFGFNYDRSRQNSEYTFGAFKKSDFTKVTGDSFLLDVRIPLNSAFTFGVRGGINKSTNDIFTGEKVDYSGYDIGFGFRAYLP